MLTDKEAKKALANAIGDIIKKRVDIDYAKRISAGSSIVGIEIFRLMKILEKQKEERLKVKDEENDGRQSSLFSGARTEV